jgi:hypothetical protein
LHVGESKLSAGSCQFQRRGSSQSSAGACNDYHLFGQFFGHAFSRPAFP